MSKKKTAKRNNKEFQKIETVKGMDQNIGSKLFIIFCVGIIFLAFYLLTLYITNKNSDTTSTSNEEDLETAISYDEIMVGRSLSMNEDEYLVLFYDESDEDISSIYSSLASNYRIRDDVKLYTVDMSNSFNKPYATEESSNKSPDSVQDFQINGPTLIRVNEGKVVEYIEGEDSITNYLS